MAPLPPLALPTLPRGSRGAERHLACPAQGKSGSASGPVLAEAMSPTTAPQPASSSHTQQGKNIAGLSNEIIPSSPPRPELPGSACRPPPPPPPRTEP